MTLNPHDPQAGAGGQSGGICGQAGLTGQETGNFSMATVLEPDQRVRGEERFVLHGIDWKVYDTMVQILGNRAAPRLTYDGRNLELMSPSPAHEIYKIRFGRLLEALAYELNIEILGGGSMTFRRPDVSRGLEPDQCYWIRNEPTVRGKQDIDLSVDPPPDLAIEIDVSRSALDRMSIYSKLGIPEVWSFNGNSLRIQLLQSDGTYAESETSLCLPPLPVQELIPFLQPDDQTGDTARIRRFVAQVRRYFSQDEG
jgi:Uma2 family endonuclease